MLAFDHGALGYGSIAAHGHADALALWLHMDGQPVLVDAGTYLYHAGGQWRSFFRGTSAHNTLCVEKTGASTMSGNFNWARKAHAGLISSEYGKEEWQVEAEHDGYRKNFGTVHRRTLVITPASGFTVEDTLSGKSPRHVDIGFLIHPSLTLAHNGKSFEIRSNRQALLLIVHQGNLATSIETGWHAPHFGEKLPAQRIVFSGMLALGEKAITRFYYL